MHRPDCVRSRSKPLPKLPLKSLLLFVAPLMWACEQEPAKSPEPSAAPTPSTAPTVDADLDPDPDPSASDEDLERLTMLGYVDASPEPADPGRTGATVHERGAVSPGLSLVTSHRPCAASLIDVDGREVRRWNGAGDCPNWVNARLLGGGDLLVTEGKGGLTRLAWDGAQRWRRKLGQHHDARAAPGGKLALLLHERRDVPAPETPAQEADGNPAAMATRRIFDDILVLATPAGEVVEQRSLFDLVGAGGAIALDWSAAPDLFHANSVQWMEPPPALVERSPVYGARNVLVSLRNQDALVVIDWDEARVVWSWGPGVLDRQHDASLLDDGRILVFDNGMRRGWSRVLEVDPVSRQVVWEYGAEPEQRFFSKGRGSAQRLPNGNTLIADSDNGRAFEVTRTGDLVWEFHNPHLVERNGRNHRSPLWIRRYPQAWLPAPLVSAAP